MRHTFFIIGLGSMGKRRIRNLLALGIKHENLIGFDPSRERCREVEKTYDIRTVPNFKKGFDKFNPNVFIISTPPHLHAEYFLFAAKRKIHFFVEVTTVDTGYAKLKPLLSKKYIAAPSATFRYVPAVIKLKDMIGSGDIGKILSFQHYLGQYLPDWHPNEDYRKVYFAQKATGGAREMFPYELQWLNYLMKSTVSRAVGVHDHYSDLRVPADDIYTAILEYKNKVLGSMTIDLLNRTPERMVRIIGTKGTLEWDWLGHVIKLLKPGRKPKVINLRRAKKLAHYNTTENIYKAEMKDFLGAINGKKPYPYSFAEDWEILKTLYKVERSYQRLKAGKVW